MSKRKKPATAPAALPASAPAEQPVAVEQQVAPQQAPELTNTNTDQAAEQGNVGDADAGSESAADETVEPRSDEASAPAALSIDEQLAQVRLQLDEDGLVTLAMECGLSGPDLCLAPGDEHRCAPDEAVRLAAAGFARQGPLKA